MIRLSKVFNENENVFVEVEKINGEVIQLKLVRKANLQLSMLRLAEYVSGYYLSQGLEVNKNDVLKDDSYIQELLTDTTEVGEKFRRQYINLFTRGTTPESVTSMIEDLIPDHIPKSEIEDSIFSVESGIIEEIANKIIDLAKN